MGRGWRKKLNKASLRNRPAETLASVLERHRQGETLDEELEPPRQGKTLDAELKRQRRAFEYGCLGALLDSIHLCFSYKRRMPDWVFGGLGTLFMRSFMDKQSELSRWLRAHQKDRVDYARYFVVKVLRESDPPVKWEDCWAKASDGLRGTVSAGSSRSVQESYKRVKRQMRTQPFRYYTLTRPLPYPRSLPPALPPVFSKK
jgi:hypothetical protein